MSSTSGYGAALRELLSDSGAGDSADAQDIGEIEAASVVPWYEAWHREEWNRVRARIEGDVPRIQVWINDKLVRDWTANANYLPDGATDGHIAIQVHRNGVTPGQEYQRWVPGGFWRWRTIAVKELP